MRRVLRFVLLVITSLVAVASGLVGIAVWLGKAISEETEALDVAWMYVGSIGLGVILILLFAWWARFFHSLFMPARLSGWQSLGVGLLLLVLVVIPLSAREIPGETILPDHVTEAREAGAGRYDLLLVIDPGDPFGRQLIRAAEKAKRPLLPDPDQSAVKYDVAYGLAVPRRRHGGQPLWELVEPPTRHEHELTTSLARIPVPTTDPGAAGRVSPAVTSYGRLLHDTLDDDRIGWRSGAHRSVVFILRKLPSLAELNAGIARRGWRSGRVMPANGSGQGRSVCSRDLGPSSRPGNTSGVATEVAWRDAVMPHCERHAGYREWRGLLEAAKKRKSSTTPEMAEKPKRPKLPVALHVLTAQDGRLASLWSDWAKTLGGRFDSSAQPGSRALLRAATAAQTGQPFGDLGGDLEELVESFRPHLLFDWDEKFSPVDVDWLLQGGDKDQGQKPHRVCDRTSRNNDICEDIDNATGLLGHLDEYIDFREGGHRGY